MKKILHITTDNKFISHALSTFESVYPNQNTVWMLNVSGETNVANNQYDKKFTLRQRFSPKFLNQLKQFDLVILHSFIASWYPLIALAPRSVRFAWLGWGYDYYNYIYKDSSELLLEDTLKLSNHMRETETDHLTIKNIVRYPIKLVMNKVIKKVALKRIASFSPVLEEDYNMVKEAKLISSLPQFMPWNYGSLEENLVANFIDQRVIGNSILVGNNASMTNNHIEAFNLIATHNLPQTIKVFVPLSYGNEDYKRNILEKGGEQLNGSFYPIVDFMPIDAYVELIKQCGYVIMNHKRQQAVGNIVIMLYLGARVFLREENPTYKMLKKEGAILNTVQELSMQPELLQKPLSENEIQKNIAVLYKHWSKEAIDTKTKNLVEFHLGASE